MYLSYCCILWMHWRIKNEKSLPVKTELWRAVHWFTLNSPRSGCFMDYRDKPRELPTRAVAAALECNGFSSDCKYRSPENLPSGAQSQSHSQPGMYTLSTDSSSVQGSEFSLASVNKLQPRYCGPEMIKYAAVALLPLHLPDAMIKSHQPFNIMEANQLQQKDFAAQLSHDV